ncbi:hypothetical protein [Mycobacterium sp. 4858]|uniref:hypothetical protein n=1 Tax=Mycobacterium sp. 4858 TaxID=2057185 RepID=UPI000C84889B|nr:hypothetical protein [Mycobacterium sp. 4858]
MWYFLRSTDLFASRVITGFGLAGGHSDGAGENPYFASFDFEDRNWLPEFHGRLPSTDVSEFMSDEALPIRLENLREIDADTIYVMGQVVPPTRMLFDLVRRYFLVDLPDHFRPVDDLSRRQLAI